MKLYIFIGVCLLIGGISVLLTGGASWGSIHIEKLTGMQLYLSSIPEILLGIYILGYVFNKYKVDK